MCSSLLRVYPDGARTNGVLGDVRSHDAGWRHPPHATNKRATILDDEGAWFGFEQEYFFYKDGRPLGFPETGYPAPARPLLHRRGAIRTSVRFAREIVEKHLDLCLFAGINHEGINAEVAKGQWEFQIFGKGSKRAADEMWMARYLLQRLTETYGIDIEYHCKPLGDTDWNGSGMHANFSTTHLRETGGKAYFEALMAALRRISWTTSPSMDRTNDKRLTASTRLPPGTSSATAWPIAALRSACRTRSSRTTTRAILRTAVRIAGRTPTNRFPDPEDDRFSADRRQGRRRISKAAA